MGLFDLLTGWKSILISVAVAGSLGFGLGGTAAWKYQAAHYTAKIDMVALNTANETIRRLQENIKLNEETLAADAKRAETDQAEINRMKGTVDDLLAKISGGVCLSRDDVDRLRSWWGSTTTPKRAPPRKRPTGHKAMLPNSDRGAYAWADGDQGRSEVDR